MEMEDALQTFIAESQELLVVMEDCLLGLENTEDKTDSISSIFRAAHTIKGSAGLFGLNDIVSVTHVAESVLDKIRNGDLDFSDDLVGLLLKFKDHADKMITAIASGAGELSEDDQSNEREIITELNKFLESTDVAAPKDSASDILESSSSQQVLSNCQLWDIQIKFGEDVLRNGMDPLSFIRYLGTIGKILGTQVTYEVMPEIDLMDPESCYLTFSLSYESDAGQEAIVGAFEFVKDDCELSITPTASGAQAQLGEAQINSTASTVSEDNVSKIPNKSVTDGALATPINPVVAREKSVPEKTAQAKTSSKDNKPQQTVRVDAHKLDSLINLIGELVIAGSGIETKLRQLNGASAGLMEDAQTAINLIEEVRDGALNLRMVQIGETFNRFARVVRDVSKELNKDIELNISGADTELDKSVVEKISDPLTHLVRNAIDHGIESTELRVASGKPEKGLVQLNAYHESGSIVIEVEDDGGGLDAQKILQKAMDKGLVSSERELSRQEVFQLIFEPGFSTADQVSNISGRGVGMDVVRRNIEALRGSIEIESELMLGTLIRIRLPLTLAIIDGFLVKISNSAYVIPLDMVVECIELDESHRLGESDNNYISLRGEVLPYMRLREIFELPIEKPNRESVVVVRYGNVRAGLVVDSLVGEFQTVIKPMGKIFENLNGLSGSTILGSGEVALILDVPGLVQCIEGAERRQLNPRGQSVAH